MHKPRALTTVLIASALAVAPMSTAFAGGSHWSHGGSYHASHWHGGGGHWRGGIWWPAAAAAAVVGTAAALVAAPFVAFGFVVSFSVFASLLSFFGPSL